MIRTRDLSALRSDLSRQPPVPHVDVNVPDQRPRAATLVRDAAGALVGISYDGHARA